MTDSSSSALYIGGNNIVDVNITGNVITGGPGTTAIVITPGYGGNPTAWLESSNRPLERFVIEDNQFDGMAYGFRVLNLSQLDNDETIQLISNEFCTVSVAAIGNEITESERSVLALDNDFCDADVNGIVLIMNTPAGTGDPQPVGAEGDAQLAATGVNDSTWLGLASGGAALLFGMALLFFRSRGLRIAARRYVR